jgi:molecular chaperone IbpA
MNGNHQKIISTIHPKLISQRWESQPIKNLIPSLIGFDNFFDLMDKVIAGEATKVDNYPPRNVIRFDDNNWEVQFAVAGFSKEDLTITVDGNILLVKGIAADEVAWKAAFAEVSKVQPQYLLKGIGLRNFEHQITFPENAIITPSLKDGLLRISISKPLQETNPQKLEIL